MDIDSTWTIRPESFLLFISRVAETSSSSSSCFVQTLFTSCLRVLFCIDFLVICAKINYKYTLYTVKVDVYQKAKQVHHSIPSISLLRASSSLLQATLNPTLPLLSSNSSYVPSASTICSACSIVSLLNFCCYVVYVYSRETSRPKALDLSQSRTTRTRFRAVRMTS